jgi:two-component system response regulator PilR (NtrC family)
MAERILIVDDEDIIRDSLVFVFQKEGYEVSQASNGAEAYRQISAQAFDVVITDIEMPEMKGIELLEKITQFNPQTFVMIITAFASIETAVSALRKGAYDYIIKPLDFDDLLMRIRRLLDHRKLVLENQILRQEIHREYDFSNIIGQSAVMQSIFRTIQKVSLTDGTVLITGKSGSGKELVARAIHFNSTRQQLRFIAVNCGAIVDNLFESELFGHKKGSFTGAMSDKEGLFKFADKGTIFLDEVSEIPYHLQVKLLRAIEQKEIFPVGSASPILVDVRIIAATNKKLLEEVEKGRFREDLYYRLNIIEIDLPTLAERRDDIPLLVQHFIEKYRMHIGKNIQGVDQQVMQRLMSHTWKGEVRELENVIERAMIFAEGDFITLADLPESINGLHIDVHRSQQVTLKLATKEFERTFIQHSLQVNGYDKEKTAKQLDISVSSLYRKIEELDIQTK